MNRIRIPILLLLVIALCAMQVSCATQQPAQKPTRASKEKPYRFEAEGNIPSLEESEIIKETDFEEVPLSEEEILEEDVEVPPIDTLLGASTPGIVSVRVDGFRVQLFATSSEETAEAVRGVAELKLGIPVYTEQIEGLYKVRAGNCRNREAAEELLKRCQLAGYGDAWIVETRVTVPSKSP